MSFKKKTSYPKLMQNMVPRPRMNGNSTFNGAKYIPKRVISWKNLTVSRIGWILDFPTLLLYEIGLNEIEYPLVIKAMVIVVVRLKPSG